MTEWRPVVGWEGFYEVSDDGRVRSYWRRRVLADTPRELTLSGIRPGYPWVYLSNGADKRKKRRVHLIVLEAFRGPRPAPGMHARHLDGDPSNCRLENLAWGTPKENAADTSRYGGYPTGEDHHRVGAKLTPDDVREIRRLLASGSTVLEISRRFAVSTGPISGIKKGTAWKWVK